MRQITIILCLIALSACTSQPIRQFTVPTYDQITIQEIVDTINDNKHWNVKAYNEEYVIAHLNSKHEVVTKITPTDVGLVFDYVYSSLETEDHQIHKNYYRWINNLGVWIKKRAPLTHAPTYIQTSSQSKKKSNSGNVNVNISSCIANC
ncbi:hypothetical protein GNP84_01870 [Aliivibrio fischeri]|uniref:hypothetical protein n=1 Tax=Aliivibrio fischeri TaxID=668 RepID=UPI0012D9B540|nr:hypothetical protein [Aliivibrio fischeri]MUK75649.1 hypothetical protein [Aliivibrio fischeri]